MMRVLRGMDVSHWQRGIDMPKAASSVDFVICKATEGSSASGMVDAYCDGWIQTVRKLGKLYGFYHVLTTATGTAQADYFWNNCKNYFHEGVPVLDIEGTAANPNDPDRAYDFCQRMHTLSGVWPVIYINRSCLNQRDWSKVAGLGCGLWIANWPNGSTTHEWAERNTDRMSKASPFAFAAIWQFTSTGRVSGYSGDVDLDLFFGDADAWHAYAGSAGKAKDLVVEDEIYKVTVERKG